MKLWRFLGAVLLAPAILAMGGCAHPINIQPNTATLQASAAAKIDRRVGLVITEADRKLEVTTPGGGGDKVTYLPYRDLETGLYIAMSQVFSNVVRLAAADDPKAKAEAVSLIVTPRITTSSYSDSALTWPPTQFTVELTCKVVDAQGQPVTEVRVVGDGRASFDEFKSQFSLSANRAADDALAKLVKALGETPALR